MAKFCGKCGTKLDEATGLCPNCDIKKIRNSNDEITETNVNIAEFDQSLSKREISKKKKADKRAFKKEQRKEKRTQWSLGKKICRFFLKIFLIVLLLAILSASGIGVLVYLNIVDVSGFQTLIDKYLSEEETEYVPSVERNLPETDESGFNYYSSSIDNIVCDKSTGLTFINNELLVSLSSNNKKANLESYLSTIGGKIVGEIPELAEYQILFEKEYTYAQLMELSSNIAQHEWVSDVMINYTIEMDVQYIPNDSKWENEWEDVPDGENWGLEAIDAVGAWDYIGQMQSVNVGVIDDMFDLNHEDLVFSESPLGSTLASDALSNEEITWSNHGTHTSGTIAASFNNKKGIAGISVSNNLYGVSIRGLDSTNYTSLQAWKIALYYLIVT